MLKIILLFVVFVNGTPVQKEMIFTGPGARIACEEVSRAIGPFVYSADCYTAGRTARK